MTRRAEPARSWESAWRHLFRHIHEPKELRRNPIAADFLARTGAIQSDQNAVRAIVAAVCEALDDYELRERACGRAERAHRRRAIVEGQIIGHQPAAAVARALHLSRMQLYRERRAVCESLAGALARAGSASLPIFVARNACSDAIERAKVLIARSQPQGALAVLDDVARSCGEPESQIAALCVAGDALREQFEFERAAQALDGAQSVLRTGAAQLGARLALNRARVELAQASLARSVGAANGSRRRARRALGEILHAELDEENRAYAVDELLKAASDSLHDGNFKEFREHLRTAQSLFASLRERPARQKAQFSLLVGLLQEDLNECAPFDDSYRMLAAAGDMARKEGFLLIAIDAELSAAGLRASGRGDSSGALREALPAVQAALRTGNRAVIGSACVFVTGLSNSNADFRGSLKFAELAVRYGKLDLRERSLLYSRMAHAYYGLGECARASRFADDACRLAQRAGNRRLLGATRRVAALAHHANRETDTARARIEEALDLLDGHGSWHALRDAYRASAIITGNREHARRAAMLARSFGG